jgi:hypothetical protein
VGGVAGWGVVMTGDGGRARCDDVNKRLGRTRDVIGAKLEKWQAYDWGGSAVDILRADWVGDWAHVQVLSLRVCLAARCDVQGCAILGRCAADSEFEAQGRAACGSRSWPEFSEQPSHDHCSLRHSLIQLQTPRRAFRSPAHPLTRLPPLPLTPSLSLLSAPDRARRRCQGST